MRTPGPAIVAGLVVLSACSPATGPTVGSTSRTTHGSTVTAPARAATAAPAGHVAAPPAPAEVALPIPAGRPRPRNYCAANTSPQRVLVSIRRQHAWMCARHRTVYESAVTTGMAGDSTSTPTGDYRIQGRNTNTVLTLNTGAQYDVRYWIPFDAPLFGFHDSSWQHFPYGSAKYKTQGSHGCIHMPLTAMKFLYDWSARPTALHIA